MRFDDVLKAVLGFEGGYSDNPNDRGGKTNLGITEGTLARAHKAGLIPHSDVKKLTRAEAATIYRAFYWDAIGGDELPEPLDQAAFDMAVNHGVGGAGRLLQRTVNLLGGNLAVDGSLGPKSREAIQGIIREHGEFGLKALCGCSLFIRTVFYGGIVANDTSQKGFLWGWIRLRIMELARRMGLIA